MEEKKMSSMRYLDSLKFPYVAAKMLVWMGHQK